MKSVVKSAKVKIFLMHFYSGWHEMRRCFFFKLLFIVDLNMLSGRNGIWNTSVSDLCRWC